MAQSVIDASNIWLNARTKRNVQKVHAREVRINKQCVSSELELVTIRPEISHADAVARYPARIGDHQLRIWPESFAESLC